ncbi:hypothetical protein BDR07DRAFT_1490773 [Suillus spraguei]|nr:hypothetical protein BDR07DRAFT_1490773 [Suillus spraguei]
MTVRSVANALGMEFDDLKDITLRDLAQAGKDNTNTAMPPAVPAPPYRHAAPSGPWPWMDFDADFDFTTSTAVIEPSWRGYPQSQFGNWTPDQVQRSKMFQKCEANKTSTIYWMDVRDDGTFARSNMGGKGDTMAVGPGQEDGFWDMLITGRPKDIRIRSIFVDDLTSPVLRMLGTRYNIEPFFFTSSINWIPSRYREASIHKESDHITITLPFVRTLRINPRSSPTALTSPPPPSHIPTQIDTQAPFPMNDGNMLFIDLLAIHMVRGVKTSTVISYHPDSTWCRTSAKRLHFLMRLVGESVYWQKIFHKSKDPTFLFLAILWYPLYAWDESLELLHNHSTGLESRVMETNNSIELTRELHILQAHLLYYQALLYNFEASVRFLAKIHNPAMESSDFSDEQRTDSKELMEIESRNLLSEIERLELRRTTLSSRVKNMMDLAFADINIDDNSQTRRLTQATVRDSAAMKQASISYLTMVFLPASLLASVFGMNVMEFNQGSLMTLDRYVEVAISLTLFTVYTVVTLQPYSSFHDPGAPFLRRAVWPILTLCRIMTKTRVKTVEDMA